MNSIICRYVYNLFINFYFFIHQQAIAQMITLKIIYINDNSFFQKKGTKKSPLQKQTRTNNKKYLSR
jgi:hypothetical protein